MSDQVEAIIRLRRGPDSERRLITFDRGEIVFSSDISHLFIGDGATTGGKLVGNLNYISNVSPSPSGIYGDLYFNPDTNIVYMLSSDAGPDNINNYARLTPDGDGVTVFYDKGKYTVSYSSLDTRYVNITGDLMTGSLSMGDNNIRVNLIKSDSVLVLEKPVTTTLKNYNEIINTIDVNAANSYAVLDLSASNNFYVNLYANMSGIKLPNCPSDGASFTIIFRHMANNLKMDWVLSASNTTAWVTPKWQMGRLPLTSKVVDSEDAVAFVSMSNRWYGFIAATNMSLPYPTTIS